MKWVHPLKGRTIKQTMADTLDVSDDGFWRNCPVDIAYNGLVSWGHDEKIHSWDSMRDCLKYGFTESELGCIVAKNNDWNRKPDSPDSSTKQGD